MPNVSYEKIESIFEEKLREAIQPLTKQVEDAMKNINFISEKYDEIIKLLKVSEEERKLLVTENKNLKAKVLQSENEIKPLQQSFNDMDQYLRRDCVEIRGLPIDSKQNSNNLVLKIAEKIVIDIKESDISVSHILPRRNFVDQSRLRQNSTEAIIVKFVQRDIKDKFYRARKNLKNLTAANFDFESSNKIFINENLTRKNKELFNSCLNIK